MNVNVPNFECPTCHKQYKRQECFKKHIILCDILNSRKNIEEEIQDLPNIYELYTIVKELGFKYDECKKECIQLKKRINILEKNDKRDSPQDYLYKNKRCDESFYQWIQNIKYNTDEIKQLTSNNCFDIICNIIHNNHNFNSPIVAFKHKQKNIIMIYNTENWQEFTLDDSYKLFKSILQSIITNSSDLKINNDSLTNIIKILTANELDKDNYINFKLKLFKQIKQNINF